MNGPSSSLAIPRLTHQPPSPAQYSSPLDTVTPRAPLVAVCVGVDRGAGIGGWHHPQALDATRQGVAPGQDPQTAIDIGEMVRQRRVAVVGSARPLLVSQGAGRGASRGTHGATDAVALKLPPIDRWRCERSRPEGRHGRSMVARAGGAGHRRGYIDGSGESGISTKSSTTKGARPSRGRGPGRLPDAEIARWVARPGKRANGPRGHGRSGTRACHARPIRPATTTVEDSRPRWTATTPPTRAGAITRGSS